MKIKVGNKWVVPFYGVRRLRYGWGVIETHTGRIYDVFKSQMDAWNSAYRINCSIGFDL